MLFCITVQVCLHKLLLLLVRSWSPTERIWLWPRGPGVKGDSGPSPSSPRCASTLTPARAARASRRASCPTPTSPWTEPADWSPAPSAVSGSTPVRHAHTKLPGRFLHWKTIECSTWSRVITPLQVSIQAKLERQPQNDKHSIEWCVG